MEKGRSPELAGKPDLLDELHVRDCLKNSEGPTEVAQQFRVLTALTEDLSSVLSTQKVLYNTSVGDSDALCRLLHAHGAFTLTQANIIYIQIKLLKLCF
jgi:hypothetical protein